MWQHLREKIRQDIFEHGYNEKRQCFVQYYGSDELDASLLMMGLVGFLKPDDPRLVGTVKAIEQDLLKDGLVMRYRSDVDGLTGEEGSFLACSFWLVDSFVLLGWKDKAQALFERLMTLRNDVGLFSEEYCPIRKRMLGNFPQAFSHISHVNTAMNLSEAHGTVGDRDRTNGHATVP